MPVGPEGGSQVAVAKDALHAMRVDTCTQEESGGRVPKVVEAERLGDRSRPHHHPAHGTETPLCVRVVVLAGNA